jgi:hypothetical protein
MHNRVRLSAIWTSFVAALAICLIVSLLVFLVIFGISAAIGLHGFSTRIESRIEILLMVLIGVAVSLLLLNRMTKICTVWLDGDEVVLSRVGRRQQRHKIDRVSYVSEVYDSEFRAPADLELGVLDQDGVLRSYTFTPRGGLSLGEARALLRCEVNR